MLKNINNENTIISTTFTSERNERNSSDGSANVICEMSSQDVLTSNVTTNTTSQSHCAFLSLHISSITFSESIVIFDALPIEDSLQKKI